jgi:hypothetical protein
MKATYGDNFERVANLKKKYDPSNLFRVNQNIRQSLGQENSIVSRPALGQQPEMA